MNSLKLKSLVNKVVKGFIAGGLASLALTLDANNFTVSSIADLENLAKIIFSGFLTGAVLSAIKAFTWKDEQI